MDWLTAAILAMGLSVGVTITDKYIVSYFSPRVFTFLVGFVGLLSLLFLPLANTTPTSGQWLFGIIIGIVFAFVIYTAFKAYQKDEISRFAPLTMLSTIVITAGGAIFFGERLSEQQFWAFGLFLVGAFLLATRLETFVFFEGKGQVKTEDLHGLAMRTLTDPIGAGLRTSRQLAQLVDRVVHDWVKAAKDPQITWIRFVRKLRLIKGLGWYLLSLGLYIPYVLFSKQLNTETGVVAGWVAIRVGLFIGTIFLMLGHWGELRQLKRKRITIIATIKEFFGMGVNYLILFASTAGIVGIVQALWAVEAVGVLIVSTTLARFGIIKESLARKDLIQKGVGVLFIALATVLLFL